MIEKGKSIKFFILAYTIFICSIIIYRILNCDIHPIKGMTEIEYEIFLDLCCTNHTLSTISPCVTVLEVDYEIMELLCEVFSKTDPKVLALMPREDFFNVLDFCSRNDYFIQTDKSLLTPEQYEALLSLLDPEGRTRWFKGLWSSFKYCN